MKCHTVRPWLLAATADEVPPGSVHRHLDECDACRTLREQLAALTGLLPQLPSMPPGDEARARLQQRLDQTPQVSPPRPADHSQRPRYMRWLPRCAAAIALVGLGWLMGKWRSPPPAVAENPRPADMGESKTDAPEPVASILVRVAEHGSRVVEPADAGERLDALAEIAEDLRGECLRLAGGGQLDELPRLTALYDRTLRTGVVPLAARLDDKKRTARLAEQLRAHGADVAEREREAIDSVAELLRPLEVSAREAAVLVEQRKNPKTPAPVGPAGPALLDRMVVGFIRVADDDEPPLRRADAGADLAQALEQATVFISMSNLPDDATRISHCLETVMSHGVMSHLDRAEASDLKGAKREEIDRIRDRMAQAGLMWERNLAKAPPPVQKGLQRALDALQQFKDRWPPGNKGGKGPPWGRPEHGFKDGKFPGWPKRKD